MTGEENREQSMAGEGQPPGGAPEAAPRLAKKPPPPPYTPIGVRLYNLRRRAEAPVVKVGLLGCLPLAYIGFHVFYFFGVFSIALVGLISELGEEYSVVATVFFGIAVIVACGLAVFGMIWVARAAFNRYHRDSLDFLRRTSLPLVILDNIYVEEIIDKTENIFSLRWISAPRPKTIEQQLDFAACYFAAYKRILWGPGRLDGGSVWRGSFAWFTGQRMCCICGCVGLYAAQFLTLPMWVIGGLAYLQRQAALAAICDYLMGDELTAELPQAWRGY